MLEQKVIEPAQTEWAAPRILATKKDGIIRFYVDNRRLDALTARDSYRIPRMDECIDLLGEATVFSTLDANRGYWQVKNVEKVCDEIAFT